MRARWARISAWAVLSASSVFSARRCQDASAWASRPICSSRRPVSARVMAALIRSRLALGGDGCGAVTSVRAIRKTSAT